MPIVTECEFCFREYRLDNHLAGKKIRCKECGEVVAVPAGRGRGGDGRRSGRRPQARPAAVRDEFDDRDRGPRRSRQERGSSVGVKKPLMIAGAAVGGVLLFGVLAFFGIGFISSLGSGVTIDGPAADEFKAKYGDKHAITVIVHDAQGDPDVVKKFLLHRIGEQARSVYQVEKQRADRITAENKRAAENVARDQGEMFYRYREEEKEYTSSHVMLAREEGSTYTFLATPCEDPAAFVAALNIGGIDSSSGREVHVKAAMPDPIPDPQIENLKKTHGNDRVYQLVLTGANGEEADVKNYVAMHIYLARNQNRRYTATSSVQDCIRGARMQAWAKKGDGRYQFTLAPLDKPEELAAAIDFGTATVDRGRNTISIATNLPNPVPTLAELTAEREKIRAEAKAIADADAAQKAEDRRLADKKRVADKAIRDADWAKRPRPNESELEWAKRIIEKDDPFAVPVVLDALVKMDPQEDKQLEIATILGKKYGQHRYPIEKLLPAFKHWCPEDQFEPTLIQWLKSDKFGSNVEPVAQELAKSKSEAGLAAIAGTLENTFAVRKTLPILKQIGPDAEDAVLAGADHADQAVRGRVYEILAVIGTAKSVKVLEANVRKESIFMKRKAQAALDQVKARRRNKPDEPK